MTAAPPLSILVVDDDPDSAWSTAGLLTIYGHVVRVALSGEDALQLAGVETPDVILLDVGMPGLDGWEVARQLRGRATRKQPVVVAVTGYGTAQDRCRSDDAGVDLHLVKPVDPGLLKGLLLRFQRALAPPIEMYP